MNKAKFRIGSNTAEIQSLCTFKQMTALPCWKQF